MAEFCGCPKFVGRLISNVAQEENYREKLQGKSFQLYLTNSTNIFNLLKNIVQCVILAKQSQIF